MDTLGLGLENYDPPGRWRDSYPGQSAKTDASGTMPDGYFFDGPSQLVSRLASQPDVRACLVKQVLSLALTRVAGGASDQALADAIGETQLSDTGTFSGMLAQLVESPQSRQQVGEAP